MQDWKEIEPILMEEMKNMKNMHELNKKLEQMPNIQFFFVILYFLLIGLAIHQHWIFFLFALMVALMVCYVQEKYYSDDQILNARDQILNARDQSFQLDHLINVILKETGLPIDQRIEPKLFFQNIQERIKNIFET